MKSNYILSHVIALLVFGLTGCQASKQIDVNTLPLIRDLQKIMSTRSEVKQNEFFALVKLKKPALLEKSSRLNSVTVIDQNLKAEIETEQAEVIARIHALSPDAQIVFRYKMVLNAIAVVGPIAIFDQLNQFGLIATWEKVGEFSRPAYTESEVIHKEAANLAQRNSVKFIGAEDMHKLGISGQGIKVGIIDSGIDYTHKMFGGIGTIDAYKAVDPNQVNAFFPSQKVVGGVDLVGTDYNPGSPLFAQHIPHPDLNPIDESGHGTHVAGTIAGHGDNNVTAYDGVAPEASLYAIKVFGKGSTSDMVVIAGLEFAADPNGDGLLEDQLDVVNLSLGSSYGTPKLLYSEAVKNLVYGGTSAVISAGNSGNVDYIVGAPGSSTEALSVAASIDDTDHNWKFDVSLLTLGNEKVYVESLEAATTKPIAEAPVSGTLFYIGLADKDLSDEQINALNGKVAFIDRGGVNFDEKIKRAVNGGAIGVVVANNKPGVANIMGTTIPFNIPAIMVTLEDGNKIKAAIDVDPGSAVIYFQTDRQITKPELIDTIADFSSKGPRSNDGYLKPEITAPGYQIISAGMGQGEKVVQMSGTSMAAPHMTGVMALIKQNYKAKGLDLSALELKNIAMSHTKTLSAQGKKYPVTRQGSGRTLVDHALMNAVVVANIPSLAFGQLSVSRFMNLSKNIKLKNITDRSIELSPVFEGSSEVVFFTNKKIVIPAGKEETLKLNFNLDIQKMSQDQAELDGLVKFLENGVEVLRVPFLAIAKKQSAVQVTQAKLDENKILKVSLQNVNPTKGQVQLFNLISDDSRKLVPAEAKGIMNNDCDLQSVSYRILNKKDDQGAAIPTIQFAFKIFKPMTSWDGCDMSVLFDSNLDGIIDQELVGTKLANIKGLAGNTFSSVLLDTQLAKKIRKDYDDAVAAAGNDIAKITALDPMENYLNAVIDAREAQFIGQSTIVVLEAELSRIIKDANNNIHFKMLSSYIRGNPVEVDDYVGLVAGNEGVFSVNADEKNQPFYGFVNESEVIDIEPLSAVKLQLIKGQGIGQLLALFPQNKFSLTDRSEDKQSAVLKILK